MYFLDSLVKEKCIFKWTLAKDGVVVVVVGSPKGKLWSPNFPLQFAKCLFWFPSGLHLYPICQLWSPNGPIRSSNGQIWFPNDLLWSLNGQLMVGVKEKEGWVKGFLVIFQKINRRDLGGRIFIYERHGHGQLGMGKLLFGPHITSVWCFN